MSIPRFVVPRAKEAGAEIQSVGVILSVVPSFWNKLLLHPPQKEARLARMVERDGGESKHSKQETAALRKALRAPTLLPQ